MSLPDTPLFSVIIPVYNKELYVQRSVYSVLNQYFENFELIIVCDPSTDNSAKEVAKFADDRIRVLNREEPGPGGMLPEILGIKMAKGQFVTFLDADDEWCTDHLLRAKSLIDNYDALLYSTSWMDSRGDGAFTEPSFLKKFKKEGVQVLDFMAYLEYASRGAIPVHTNVIIVKHHLFEQIGGFPENECVRGGDLNTWFRLIRYTDEIVCLPEATAIYHREVSTVTKASSPKVQDNCIYHVVKKAIEEENDLNIKAKLKKFSNYHIVHALKVKAINGRLSPADCAFHYSSVAKSHHFIFILWSLLPGVFQRSIYRLIKQIS